MDSYTMVWKYATYSRPLYEQSLARAKYDFTGMKDLQLSTLKKTKQNKTKKQQQ